MDIINLPIFPLPVFLLPQGLTRLRIFEPRYLKMVALAMKNHGFVILADDRRSRINKVTTGSWVEIINFDQSEGGLLLIDVRCKCLVDIKSMIQDKDNLHHGDVMTKAHWPETGLDKITDKLAKSLSKLFQENAELNTLYPMTDFEQGNWVVARWLELLPVQLEEKNLFIEQDSFVKAERFLQSILLPEE
jgi:uncharacterized protein